MDTFWRNQGIARVCMVTGSGVVAVGGGGAGDEASNCEQGNRDVEKIAGRFLWVFSIPLGCGTLCKSKVILTGRKESITHTLSSF